MTISRALLISWLKRPRKVYVVCMPGEPAYPVLAVCPPPAPPTSATADVGSVDRHNQRQPSSAGPPPPSNLAAEAGIFDETPPVGFLLKWETSTQAQTGPAFVSTEGELLLGNSGDTDGALIIAGGESGGAQEREAEQNSRRYYGRGGHPGGFGKVTVALETYLPCQQ